jgi:hypothetical protein
LTLFALPVLTTLPVAAGAVDGGGLIGSSLTGIILDGGVDFFGVRSTIILWLLLRIMFTRGVTGRKVVTITNSNLLITVISLSLIVSIALPLRACLASLSLAFRSASAASGPVIKRDPSWVRFRLPDGFSKASGAPIGRDYKVRCCYLISTNFSYSRSTYVLKRARSLGFRLARIIAILLSINAIISGLAFGGCWMSLSY